jgi:hypothetical protein
MSSRFPKKGSKKGCRRNIESLAGRCTEVRPRGRLRRIQRENQSGTFKRASGHDVEPGAVLAVPLRARDLDARDLDRNGLALRLELAARRGLETPVTGLNAGLPVLLVAMTPAGGPALNGGVAGPEGSLATTVALAAVILAKRRAVPLASL